MPGRWGRVSVSPRVRAAVQKHGNTEMEAPKHGSTETEEQSNEFHTLFTISRAQVL